MHTRTLQRVQAVATMRAQGLHLWQIADRLGVTVRSAERYSTRPAPALNGPAMTSSTTAGWDEKAACKRAPADWFFPTSYQPNAHEVRAAKTVCGACPVLDACQRFVQAHPDLAVDGVWAATTPAERRDARRAQPERTPA